MNPNDCSNVPEGHTSVNKPQEGLMLKYDGTKESGGLMFRCAGRGAGVIVRRGFGAENGVV
jgi:hypothetical protein